MKTRLFNNLTLVALLGLVLVSCQSAPEQEVIDANAAVTAAQDAGAELYANDAYLALSDSLNAALEAVESEKSKFFKDFSKAKAQLTQVITMSQAVADSAVANKEKVKNEAIVLIAAVNALIESNKELVAQAPTGKEGATALLAIQGEIDAITNANVEANTLLTGEDFIGAKNKAASNQEKALAINAELKSVIEKTAKK